MFDPPDNSALCEQMALAALIQHQQKVAELSQKHKRIGNSECKQNKIN
jgi:hypothetical protein